jgi:RNA polymerase sigma-70 factor (ECF subfamily)
LPGERKRLDSAELLRCHGTFVARFLVRLGAARADVDDLVQEVFFAVHRCGGYAPGPASPTTFLAAVAVRVLRTHRRKRKTRGFVAADQVAVDGAPGRAGDPAAALETRRQLVRVQRVLERLDADRRAVFVLFEIEGEPCTAIAAGLGVPVGTVYSRLHAARKTFREELARELERNGTSIHRAV